MTDDASDTSLFLRLRPARSSRERGEKLDGVEEYGHEEYITQVVGAVLQADPGLTRHLLKEWTHIEVEPGKRVTVKTEVEYEATGQRPAVRVDLVIDGDDFLVFIENKVGAGLNRYLTVTGAAGERGPGLEDQTLVGEDQVELYARALEEKRVGRRGCLLVICRDPQDRHDDVHLYGGAKFWWDLYGLVEAWRRSAGHPAGSAAYLQDEMLKFFQEIHFDPPKPVRRGERDEQGARRLLAEAAARVGLKNPRMPLWLWFESGENTYEVSLRGDALSVYLVGEGARKVGPGEHQVPTLDDAFWEAMSADEQIQQLLEVIQRVDHLEPGDGNRLTIATALTGFNGRQGEVARSIAEQITKRWPEAEPSMGKNTSGVREISFSLPGGSVRLGPYKTNRLILAFGSAAVPVLIHGIERVLGKKLPTKQPSQQVNVPLNMLPVEKIPGILNVIEGCLKAAGFQ